MTDTNGVRPPVGPEFARFISREPSPRTPGGRVSRLAETVRDLSDASSEDALRHARNRRHDDALKAEGKAAGLLEAARLLAELAGEL